MKLDRDKLIRAREMLGYAIETVAEEAGVSKNSVLRAEHEEDIRPVTARKIAAALGVRVADLIGESESGKVGAPPSQLPLNGFEEERREYPYPWMSDALGRVIAYWARTVESRANPAYSRTIAVIFFDVIDAVTLQYEGGWDRLSDDEKAERRDLAERLDALAMQGFEHYKASKAAKQAEVQEIERRREEIRLRTREISA